MPTVVPFPAKARGSLLSAEEFLDWLEPKVQADLIGGKKYMHSPVNIRHAELVNFVDRLLGLYVDEFQLGSVQRENWCVRLSARDVFMPDICYFTPQQRRLLQETHAPFAPTFVIEALSPSSGKRDAREKFAAYEKHGVLEYWLLDPDDHQHRFYARDGEVFTEFGEGGKRIESRAVRGFRVERTWLDTPTKFSLNECFRQIVRKR